MTHAQRDPGTPRRSHGSRPWAKRHPGDSGGLARPLLFPELHPLPVRRAQHLAMERIFVGVK